VSPPTWEEANDPRRYRGGAHNTNDPLRVRLVQWYRQPSNTKSANMGFRCYRTVCIPRLDPE
jgi:hypothetical protein